MFYVKFSVYNTYGKDIDLKTTLKGQFASMHLPAGQSISSTVHVKSRDRVKFEAFERDSGDRIPINEEDVYWVTPQPNKDKLFILDLPGFMSMYYKIVVYMLQQYHFSVF